MRRTIVPFAAATIVAVIAGCSEGQNRLGEEKKEGANSPTQQHAAFTNTPAKITATMYNISLDAEMEAAFNNAIKQKLPHVTFEFIRPGKGTTLQELVAAGTVPDIIYTYKAMLSDLDTMGLLEDLTPYLKMYNINTDRFTASYLDKIAEGTNGKLFAIPYTTSFHALFYNKDIFDKFGVPFPKDGMLWEDTVALARKVTRIEDGIQYRGWDTGNWQWTTQPFGLPIIDPVTEKSNMDQVGWRRAFESLKEVYSIPGNMTSGNVKAQFVTNKTLAMYGQINILTELAELSNKGELNWDVVQYPSYSGIPNTYGNESVHLMALSKVSKHKEQALQVIDLLTSEDIQMELSKLGKISPLKSTDIQKAFGTGKKGLEGKNLQGIFKSKPVNTPASTVYQANALPIIKRNLDQYLAGNVDINTTLRQMDEEINKMISEEKSR